MKKIIYDIGSNNGDDIPYYLLKSDLVIAIEANPKLCDLIQKKFSKEIPIFDTVPPFLYDGKANWNVGDGIPNDSYPSFKMWKCFKVINSNSGYQHYEAENSR